MSTVDLSRAHWRKSSRSVGGNDSDCVEVALVTAEWRKSSRSGSNGSDGNCVEVAFSGPAAAVRDSKNVAGPALVFPAGAWVLFLADGRGENTAR